MHTSGDVELLAVLLGGRGALSSAARLLERFGDLRGLSRAEPSELQRQAGVGPAVARRVLAGLALGQRSMRGVPPAGRVSSAIAASRQLRPGLQGLAVEELHALYLDRRHRPVGLRHLTRGSDAFTVVDPRQIYAVAVRLGAAAVILAHNHPSGDPTPSQLDREVTRRVAKAGSTLGIPLLDHLVVATDGWRSLAELGDVPCSAVGSAGWLAAAVPRGARTGF